MIKAIGLILSSIAFVGVLWVVSQGEDVFELTCENIWNGSYAPNGSKCITEDCYASGTCGLRSYPAASCDRILIGDRISKVVLHLGDPMASDQDRFQWHADKQNGNVGVEAHFKDGRLIALSCPAFPISN